MRVEINMRPYPEQKPPAKPGTHTVKRSNGVIVWAWWHGFGWDWDATENHVTHFALPEDITITEEKREGTDAKIHHS